MQGVELLRGEGGVQGGAKGGGGRGRGGGDGGTTAKMCPVYGGRSVEVPFQFA